MVAYYISIAVSIRQKFTLIENRKMKKLEHSSLQKKKKNWNIIELYILYTVSWGHRHTKLVYITCDDVDVNNSIVHICLLYNYHLISNKDARFYCTTILLSRDFLMKKMLAKSLSNSTVHSKTYTSLWSNIIHLTSQKTT